ncbi:MAG: hypothetical protein AB7N73_00805 [Gemmatimonadales bacterium]
MRRAARVPGCLAAAMLWLAPAAAAQGSPDSGTVVPRPSFGAGMVWVMPLPLTPREIASRLSGKSEAELLDSTVAAFTTQYLEAMAAERAASASGALPSWTTTIGGQTVGLDSRYVYLGPLKVPSFLIALLPIRWPQANPMLWDQQREWNAMREDINVAGRRGAILDELEAAGKALRAEREAQREFEANQRRPPPPIEDPG